MIRFVILMWIQNVSSKLCGSATLLRLDYHTIFVSVPIRQIAEEKNVGTGIGFL